MRPGCGIDCTRKEDYLSAQDFDAVRARMCRALGGKGCKHMPAALKPLWVPGTVRMQVQVTGGVGDLHLALLLDRAYPEHTVPVNGCSLRYLCGACNAVHMP